MSAFSDLLKGNFGNIGKDLAHDPLGTGLGVLGTLGLGAFALPALGGALGLGGAEAAGVGAAGAAGAAEAGGVAGGLTPAAGLLSGADIAGDAGLAALGGAWAGGDAALPAGATLASFTGAGSDIANISGGASALGGDVLTGAAAGGSPAGSFGSGITDWLAANKGLLATAGIGGLGTLLAPKLSGMINKVPQQGQLTDLAAQEKAFGQTQGALGQTLTQPLLTGELPAAAEQKVNNATEDAINTTKARYANLGLSGSTMESDAIASIKNQATSARFDIATQMAQTGQQATSQAATAFGLQDAVYGQLMNAQVQQDAALQAAIARLAAGAALGAGTSSATKTAAGAANVFA